MSLSSSRVSSVKSIQVTHNHLVILLIRKYLAHIMSNEPYQIHKCGDLLL